MMRRIFLKLIALTSFCKVPVIPTEDDREKRLREAIDSLHITTVQWENLPVGGSIIGFRWFDFTKHKGGL